MTRLPVLAVTSRADHGGGPAHILNLMTVLGDAVDWCIACPQDVPYWDRYRQILGQDRMLAIPHRRFSLPAVSRIARFARARSVRLVHSHGKGAGTLARPAAALAGVPCVHTFHGVHLEGLGWIGRRLYAAYERAASAATAAIIAVSEGERGMMADLGLPMKKVRVIANGLEPGVPAPFPVEDGTFRIAVVTRFDPAKNSQVLPEIAAACRSINRARRWRFEVFGDGPGREHVTALAEKAGLAGMFAFHGMVPDARAGIGRCHCLLSTSVREGLPLNLIEAALVGRPVVASDVIGNREVAQAVGGSLYALDRLSEAACYLEALAAEPTTLLARGRTARERAVSLYDRRQMGDATLAVYTAHVAEEQP